jgi:uncharacterized protein (DUF58 family)
VSAPRGRRWPGFERWLTRRIPRARVITLDQRRIFIFPTRAGFCFLLALLVMLIAAINYENNLAFALVFFLLSLFIVTILHTFANLSGLRLEAGRARPVFAGETAEFEVQLRREGKRSYHSIRLAWPGQPPALASLTGETRAANVRLFHRSERRGWLRPGRLRVQADYPLGLLRAWTWVDLDLTVLVYPQPLAGSCPSGASDDDSRAQRRWREGGDEFYGFRAYRAGDNLRQVLWRAYARGQPLQSTQFALWQSASQWLCWEAAGGDRERPLAVLCHWVLALHRRGQAFGLQLPGADLAPGAGVEHRDAALRRLALFGQGGADA